MYPPPTPDLCPSQHVSDEDNMNEENNILLQQNNACSEEKEQNNAKQEELNTFAGGDYLQQKRKEEKVQRNDAFIEEEVKPISHSILTTHNKPKEPDHALYEEITCVNIS